MEASRVAFFQRRSSFSSEAHIGSCYWIVIRENASTSPPIHIDSNFRPHIEGLKVACVADTHTTSKLLYIRNEKPWHAAYQFDVAMNRVSSNTGSSASHSEPRTVCMRPRRDVLISRRGFLRTRAFTSERRQQTATGAEIDAWLQPAKSPIAPLVSGGDTEDEMEVEHRRVQLASCSDTHFRLKR